MIPIRGTRAAPARWPYNDHRTIAEVDAAMARPDTVPPGKTWCEHCRVALSDKQIGSCVRAACPVKPLGGTRA